MKIKFLLLINVDFFNFIEYSIKKNYDYIYKSFFLKYININWLSNSKIVFNKNEQSYLVLAERTELKFLFYFKNKKNIVSFNFFKNIKGKDEKIRINSLILDNEIKIGEEYFKK